MRFKVEFNLDNAAFENAEEIPTILKDIANKASQISVYEETFQMPIKDSNGTRIGYWGIKE